MSGDIDVAGRDAFPRVRFFFGTQGRGGTRFYLCLAALAAVVMVGPTLPAADLPEATGAGATNFYQLDLPVALRLARTQNLDIQIAREKLAEAKANEQSALLQFFPWIAPGAGYRRHDNLIQNVEGKIIEVHKQSYTVGASLTAQVDLGDALYKKLAAHQLAKAADFTRAAQEQDTTLAAAQGYFDLAKAQAAVEVAREALRISQDYQQQIHHAVDAGIAFKGDELRVRVQAERNELALQQSLERRRIAAARLAQILRLDSTVDLAATDTDLVPLTLVATNAVLDALVQQALAQRPELKQSQAAIAAARDTRNGAAYGPLVPGFGAQIFAGGLGGGKDGTRDSFGESEDYFLFLQWRLGPGGLLDFGRIKSAKARLNTAVLTGEKVHDEIVRQVVEGNTRVQSLTEQIAAARRALASAQETLRLTQERKELSVGVVLENIQAQQDLTRARTDYLTGVAEFNTAQYALQKAMGTPAAPSAEPSGEPR
jgi:outer membrane protein TolC